MDVTNRSSIRAGLALIVLGALFLIVQIIPGFRDIFNGQHAPDLILFGVAIVLALIGLATGAAGMAVPACILAGLGGIFYWQTASGAGPETWSYMWALIPGFVGVGIFLAELLSGRPALGLSKALGPIITSAVLFLIFASVFGGFTFLGPFWPVILIVAGLLLMLRPLLRGV
jgi:hypothetical protein